MKEHGLIPKTKRIASDGRLKFNNGGSLRFVLHKGSLRYVPPEKGLRGTVVVDHFVEEQGMVSASQEEES
jgi:hypothetical protein